MSSCSFFCTEVYGGVDERVNVWVEDYEEGLEVSTVDQKGNRIRFLTPSVGRTEVGSVEWRCGLEVLHRS